MNTNLVFFASIWFLGCAAPETWSAPEDMRAQVRDGINQYCKAGAICPKEVASDGDLEFEWDDIKKNGHYNGFGTIEVRDEIRNDPEQVLAVIVHELGHLNGLDHSEDEYVSVMGRSTGYHGYILQDIACADIRRLRGKDPAGCQTWEQLAVDLYVAPEK